MEYVIGIESGGTKSELAAYDLEQNKIYSILGGYGNPSVNVKETVYNISKLIEACLKELSNYQCKFILIGMAGADTGDFKEVLQNHIIDTYSIDNIVLNDAEMTAKAYLKDEDGIIVIAGTGASVYAQKDGKGKVIGGWGHLLGDKGSGYHTVIEAFKRMTWQIDNKIELDNLSLKLIKEITQDKFTETVSKNIKQFIYENPKKTIASLFPVIVRLANEGDEASIKLLEDAGKYLAETVIIALKEFDINKKIKIGLKGGVFYNSNVVLTSFKEEVKKHTLNCQFIDKDIPVTKAVLNFNHFNKRR